MYQRDVITVFEKKKKSTQVNDLLGLLVQLAVSANRPDVAEQAARMRPGNVDQQPALQGLVLSTG
ncbi:hypothetical protein ColTof4_13590 [Colletotrichum tofieldiae]|nr:hypothetical protein ColTof3_14540 [Colletotrichum tofieldiae]GKT81167.1 hypothetical protein ColTof4_13590 [Colletotrichum tofieldiae]GKT97321.1 hypothetical protein Ct61P_15171 [Colletotrichum tofieldiae]